VKIALANRSQSWIDRTVPKLENTYGSHFYFQIYFWIFDNSLLQFEKKATVVENRVRIVLFETNQN